MQEILPQSALTIVNIRRLEKRHTTVIYSTKLTESTVVSHQTYSKFLAALNNGRSRTLSERSHP